ncbi:SAM-dependent methyltransferase [Streptomyces graminofaciens]|jgi:O-methyltransferase|uniref:SAM-dependent methyltransferase n=1 Tax=Streptomyces graminofaciens TaxID=68212 RepID=A0ABN5VAV4_9ACTN|nr:class I SAM-dependent methyltransferase [Streptomyces graminofaciens]BBC30126.1 SAM-dependent methyltransferase [Streptomyces graminofaciens]
MAEQIGMTPRLLEYVRDTSLREDDLLRELREVTAELPAGVAMQVPAEEGQLLAFLVRLTGAASVVEIGTFTGYSTLCMARALPVGGRLVTCDITDRWPSIGAEYWKRAGVDPVIDLRVGDATETLEKLLADEGPGGFDLVFIDADKANYPRYYELSLELLRPGGLVVVDNTLFFGRVADPEFTDADTAGVRELNARLRADERVELSMLTMADGITLARRKDA